METIGVNLDADGAVIGLDYRPETHSCAGTKKVGYCNIVTMVRY